MTSFASIEKTLNKDCKKDFLNEKKISLHSFELSYTLFIKNQK